MPLPGSPDRRAPMGAPAYRWVAALPVTCALGPTESQETTLRGVPELLKMPGTPPSQLRLHAPPGTPSRVISEWPAQSPP
jgi:hypothetical protein